MRVRASIHSFMGSLSASSDNSCLLPVCNRLGNAAGLESIRRGSLPGALFCAGD